MDNKCFLNGLQSMIIAISTALIFISSSALYCAYAERQLVQSEVLGGVIGIFVPLLCSGCIIVDKIKEYKKERSRMEVNKHV